MAFWQSQAAHHYGRPNTSLARNASNASNASTSTQSDPLNTSFADDYSDIERAEQTGRPDVLAR